MYKLDFFGVTQTEYDLLHLFRDAIANTKLPRHPSWYAVVVDTENHETVYDLCDGYDVDALLYATGKYKEQGFASWEGYSAEEELREVAESKGAIALHNVRMENPELHDRGRYHVLVRDVSVKPLNLTEILAENPTRIDTDPYYIRGIRGTIRVKGNSSDTKYLTNHTLYGAITSNSGNELELGNLGDTCYACGKGIKFGIKEQYPLLTKEQQESVVGRAWGLLEAFYKDIRSRRGDFSEIPSVDEVLMLVHGYGVFPEPIQSKKRKQSRWKRNHAPIEHEEIVESLQEDEPVDEDTRSREGGKSKRKRRHKEGSRRKSHFYIEALLYVIITWIWCTPLGRLVPGLENIDPGWKLLGIIPILLWGYRIMKL